MKQWKVRAMLMVFGIWLGAVLLPVEWRAGMQRQTVEVTSGALRCLWSVQPLCPPFSAAAPLVGASLGPSPPIFSRRRRLLPLWRQSER